MGIKHLWTILGPFYERKPLFELQGKTVAVDLSCWICEAQNIADYQVQPRMYLRNLYFRTCYLLLMEVNPVFVLEGKAPQLKYDTIAARNAIQFKGAKPKTDGVKTGKDRTRFHFTLRQCEEMLGYMGLACIKGSGEAESLCAYLNEDGLVDGCISQDSDCFAYGAKVVYRNFSISQQGAYAASGGAVDVYDICKANTSLGFGRNKIIALALLCGSDYSEGVNGVGKESVLKLFDKVSDEDVIDRLRSWRKSDFFEQLERKLADKNICASCGHNGKLQAHTKNGCNQCCTTKGCDPFKFKEERLSIKNELNVRSKAIKDPNFPDDVLINEFLIKKDNVSKLDLKWKQPDMVNFVKFTTKYLGWEEMYSFQKLLPILTRWQVLNYACINQQQKVKGILYPERIKKVRNPKGVSSFEIIWQDTENYFKGLIPESQLLENVDLEKLWSTIEPQTLVEKSYPKLVEEFKQSKVKPKKVSKRKQKAKNPVDEINDLLQNTSISQPKQKKTKKATKKKITSKAGGVLEDLESSFNSMHLKDNTRKTGTLDNYLKTAVINSHKRKTVDQISENVIDFEVDTCLSSTPVKCAGADTLSMSFDLNMSNFGDENDSNVSDIIDNIISKKLPRFLEEEDLKNYDFDKACNDEQNQSSFFISNAVEDDLFEQTFNNMDDDSGESTEEYEFDKVILGGDAKKDCDNALDSFSENYVPLYERLKKCC